MKKTIYNIFHLLSFPAVATCNVIKREDEFHIDISFEGHHVKLKLYESFTDDFAIYLLRKARWMMWRKHIGRSALGYPL